MIRSVASQIYLRDKREIIVRVKNSIEIKKPETLKYKGERE